MQIVRVENLLSKVYLGSMSVLWPLEGREVADWAYLGIVDLDVPWPQGCTAALGCTVALQRCTVAPV